MIKIITRRCLIRPFTNKNKQLFTQSRNDEKWIMYQGLKGLSDAAYESRILEEGRLEEGLQLSVTDRYTDDLIGDVYLLKDEDNIWIGFSILPDLIGQGYDYEVSEAVIEWAKSQGCKFILITASRDDTPLIKLLNKATFTYSGLDQYGNQIYKMSN